MASFVAGGWNDLLCTYVFRSVGLECTEVLILLFSMVMLQSRKTDLDLEYKESNFLLGCS